jgi:hypothetical protein
LTLTLRKSLLAIVALLTIIGAGLWLIGPRLSGGETDRELFPDSRARTEVHLQTIRLVVEDYLREERKLPDSLGAITRDPAQFKSNPDRLDAWNRPILYRTAESAYELRSSGPDGVFDNEDDVVLAVRASDKQ